MFASIDDFQLANGTLSGGYALSGLRINVARIFDVVVPLADTDPVSYDRNIRKSAIDFSITRIHASAEAADKFVADHGAAIPASGSVCLIATNGTIYGIINADLIQHQHTGGIGKTTTHSYHIEGGRLQYISGPSPYPPPIPPPPPPPHDAGYFIIEEDSDYILLESAGRIKTEHQ